MKNSEKKEYKGLEYTVLKVNKDSIIYTSSCTTLYIKDTTSGDERYTETY